MFCSLWFFFVVFYLIFLFKLMPGTFVERCTALDGSVKSFCTTVVFAPSGDLVCAYRKMKPTCGGTVQAAGQQIGVFDTVFGRVGVGKKALLSRFFLQFLTSIAAICFDIEHTAVVEQLLALQPVLILNPTHIVAPQSSGADSERFYQWHTGTQM